MKPSKVVRIFGLGLTGLVILTGCTQAFSTDIHSQAPAVEPQSPELEQMTEAVEQATEPADQPADSGPVPDTEPTGTDLNADTDEPDPEPILLAGTNIALHNVPLEEIYFDTFNGRYVRLSDAAESDILRLRDAIPPIETPKYTDVAAADQWLTANDIVIGYVDGDEALAYPTRILNYHEIVNETVNDIPVLISYCPLCSSGIVYDRRLDGEVLEFGNTSALHNSDMVMYDKQTLSYWFQVEGKAIVGDLTGRRMEVLPTMFMRWADWREAYPDSRVLSLDTGYHRPYDRDPFTQLPQLLNGGRFPFPVGEAARDPTLPAGEQVISLVLAGDARAYPIEALAGQVVNDEVGGVPLAVIVDSNGTATALTRQTDDQVLTLAWAEDTLVDEETGTRWTNTGEAISGPLQDTQLELIPARFSFWFAFVAAFPEGTAYQP